jgi:transposase InsO family protein
VLLALLDTALAALWLLIGAALLLYPRRIARYYADYARERTVGPIRSIARPLARYIRSPANVWSLRLTGIVWIAMGAFLLYFLRFT